MSSAMSSVSVKVEIYLEVHDAEAFAAAARERAIQEGLGEEEAASYTTDNLEACAVMLLDPGVSPDGAEITSSSAEEFSWLGIDDDDS